MSQIAHAALSVACPACKAPAGVECRGRKKFHVPRAQRGLNRSMRDAYKTHERIWRALGLVRDAAANGRPIVDDDVTTALGSCGCGECRAQVRPLAVELHELGLIR